MTVDMQRRWAAKRVTMLCALFLAQFVVLVNVFVVTVALPSIQRDLGFSSNNLTWVVSIYMLMFGGFILLGGRGSDLFGRKRAFITGMSLFSAGSFMCGLAESQGVLVGGRALQGLGAAIAVPTILAILSTSFADGPARRRALAVWGGIHSVTIGAALVLGGVLVNKYSWSAIFFANVLLGVIILTMSTTLTSDSNRQHSHSVDVRGAMTVTCGSAAMVYATISSGHNGWAAISTIVSGIAAMLLLAAFITIERTHQAPLVRLNIFRLRTLATANAASSVVAGAGITLAYVMTLYFQHVLGYSALQTGLAFVPATAALFASTLLTYQAIKRVSLRTVLIGALAITATGVVMLTRITPHGEYVTQALPAILVTHLGIGAAGVALIILATTKVPGPDAGLASGLFNMSSEIGSAFWLAVFISLAAARTSASAEREYASALVSGFRFAFWGIALLIVMTSLITAVMLRKPLVPADNIHAPNASDDLDHS